MTFRVHEYKEYPENKDKRYYVKHYFQNVHGKTVPATYQVAERLQDHFAENGIEDGDKLSDSVGQRYKRGNLLYTKGEGPPDAIDTGVLDDSGGESSGAIVQEKTVVAEILEVDTEDHVFWLGLPSQDGSDIRRVPVGPGAISSFSSSNGIGRFLRLRQCGPAENDWEAVSTEPAPRSGELVVDRQGQRFRVSDDASNNEVIELNALQEHFNEVVPLTRLIDTGEELVFVLQDEEHGPHWKVVDEDAETDREPPRWNERESQLLSPFPPRFPEDWHGIGAAYRQTLERGLRLPEPVWKEFQEREFAGRRLSAIWSELRRNHLNVCWPHLISERTLGELKAIDRREWDPERLHERLIEYLRDRTGSDLNDYIDRLDAIPASEFRADTFELWQLVEWTEPKKEGFFPEREFLDRALDLLDIDSTEMDRSEARGALFDALPHRKDRYRHYQLEKTGGGTRWIEEPCVSLKRVQRFIADILNGYRAAHPCASGFLEGRSTALHARHHAGAKAAVKMDIRDFFPSISKEQVLRGLAASHDLSGSTDRWANPFANWSRTAKKVIAYLVCHPYGECLPQGAPSSPAIANLVAHELDASICEMIRQRMERPRLWNYSRYADDLVLSKRDSCTDEELDEAHAILREAIDGMNWEAAQEKTRRWKSGRDGPLTVCGIQIPTSRDGKLSLPRSVRRRVRAARHNTTNGDPSERDRGLLAYAYSVTGEHQFPAVTSKQAGSQIVRLGVGLSTNEKSSTGRREATEFLEGWMGRN